MKYKKLLEHLGFYDDNYGLTKYASDKMTPFYFKHALNKLSLLEEEYWGTVKELVIPKLLALIPENVHDVPVYLFYSRKFNGAIYHDDMENGHHKIRVNIAQPNSKYIESILHELSHVIDSKNKRAKQMFKQTSHLTPLQYRKQRGEIRARKMEKLWQQLYSDK